MGSNRGKIFKAFDPTAGKIRRFKLNSESMTVDFRGFLLPQCPVCLIWKDFTGKDSTICDACKNTGYLAINPADPFYKVWKDLRDEDPDSF